MTKNIRIVTNARNAHNCHAAIGTGGDRLSNATFSQCSRKAVATGAVKRWEDVPAVTVPLCKVHAAAANVTL